MDRNRLPRCLPQETKTDQEFVDVRTWMAIVMRDSSDITGQQSDSVHNTQISQPSRMTDEHVSHLQH